MVKKELGLAAAIVSGIALVALVAHARSQSGVPAGGAAGAVGAPAPIAAEPSNRFEGKNFKLALEPEGACKLREECKLVLRLEALGEFHINKEYPYKFKAEAVKGSIEFSGTDKAGANIFSKGAGDFKQEGETKATMSVRFKPTSPGEVTVGGVYKLSVCSAQNCQLETQAMQLVVAVAAPPK